MIFYNYFKKLSLTLSFLGIFLSSNLLAQDLNSMATGPKAEKAPPPSCEPPKKDPTEWDISAQAGFNLTRGNISSQLLTAGLDAIKEKDNNVYTFNLAGGEGEQENVDTQRFIRGKAGYDRLLSERLYAGVSLNFLADDIADVDYRTVGSPALGYYLLKSEETKLGLEAGPAYVFEKLGGVKNDFLAARVANNFSWKFSQTAKIFQYAEYLLNTEDTDQSIVIGKAGLEASLTSSLALVLAIEDRFNSAPAEGRKKNDVLITSGLKVSF